MTPDCPTIVLTHGLEADAARLWTGFSPTQGAQGAGHLLNNLLGGGQQCVNIVQFLWEEGLQGFSPSAYRALSPIPRMLAQCWRISRPESLGPGYQHPIHFIGHELGAVVNAYAAQQFLTATSGVTRSQFTILDYPSRTPGGTADARLRSGPTSLQPCSKTYGIAMACGSRISIRSIRRHSVT